MQRPMRLLVPTGRVTTPRTRVPYVIATVGDDLGLWQICGCGDPGAGVGSVLTWTEHRVALLAQRFGPELYAKRLRGATRCSRYSLHLLSATMAPIAGETAGRSAGAWVSQRTGRSIMRSPTSQCPPTIFVGLSEHCAFAEQRANGNSGHLRWPQVLQTTCGLWRNG